MENSTDSLKLIIRTLWKLLMICRERDLTSGVLAKLSDLGISTYSDDVSGYARESFHAESACSPRAFKD